MDLNQAISAASHFIDPDQIREITPFGHGHINDTFRVKTDESSDFLLQRVNHHVFRDIVALENNMAALARHFNYEMDPTIPEAIPAKDGKYICLDHENYWRSYVFQEGTLSYEAVPHHELLKEAGHAFGSFIMQVSAMDVLKTTIPDFQDIQHRMNQLNAALHESSPDKETMQLLELVNARMSFIDPLIQQIRSNKIPSRNVHNDTKINNLLFDKNGHARYIVDLDTVMPGYIHYDLGDALRTTASNLPEDSPQINTMILDLDAVRSFIEGFLPPLRPIMIPKEVETLYYSPVYTSLITGIRFLTDYLNGNIYYKTSYPDQNLHRAMNQIHLAGLFEEHADEIIQLIVS